MNVKLRQLIGMRVTVELLMRVVASKSAVVAGYPDVSLVVFTETGNDIPCRAALITNDVEASAYWREVNDTTIEGAYPQTSLVVGGNGIGKAGVNALLLQHLLPLATLGVIA